MNWVIRARNGTGPKWDRPQMELLDSMNNAPGTYLMKIRTTKKRVFPGLGPFSHIWHRISVRIFETVLFKSSDSRDEAIFQIKPVKRKRKVRNFVYNWKTDTTENSTPETTNSELRTEISLIISSVLRVWTWKSPVKLFSLQGSKIQSRRSLSSQRIG